MDDIEKGHTEMAQVTVVTTTCDNCDDEVPSGVEPVTITLTEAGKEGQQVDLCPDKCGPRIRALMEKGRPVKTAGRPARKASTPRPASPTGRKRGRPSKAEIAAREAAAAAEAAGEPVVPDLGDAAEPTDNGVPTTYAGESDRAPALDPAVLEGTSVIHAAPSGA